MERCVFVGNRRFVLEKLIQKGLEIKVFVAKGTHLEHDILSGMFEGISYEVVSSKKELLSYLNSIDFDLLVSNGCPYILPIEQLPNATYVNIHPSYLPDLKGGDPVIGAILFARNAGATCHIINESIDSGDIISQVKIPYTDDLDVTTLYQLSFLAEAEAFEAAYKLGFKAQAPQSVSSGLLYFTRNPKDMVLSISDTNELMLQKVKAFNNKSIGCSFFIENIEYKVFRAYKVVNPYLIKYAMQFKECEVVLSYEDSIVFHRNEEVIRFEVIYQKDNVSPLVGQKLFGV